MSYKYWHRINVSQVMFPSCSLAILWGVRPQMCFCLFVLLLNVSVNNYGHDGTVSSPTC